MTYTINIDAGGTMTDGLVVGNDQVLAFKVDSTPHDLTISMLELINRAAESMGFADRRTFLDQVSIIRWSSTVTSNVLAERRGPRIGLLVDEGQEKTLYGDGESPAVDAIVSNSSIIGLTKEADQSVAALTAIRALLETGVRRICISLAGALSRPGRELELKKLVADHYPDHYLGAVPVLLGSEIVQASDDMSRTHYSVINAYVHPALASSLFKAEDRLKIEDEWRGTLLVGHTNGGMARIGKTKAIDTIESGPVFGTQAAAYFAKQYKLPALICVDVGGTTTKVSVVRDAKPAIERGGDFFGIPVKTPLRVLRSLALGGGSVVSCTESELKIGPRSMGASPGPACYGLGGTESTLTDCLTVLGYVDPAKFLGGRRRLNVEYARAAIEKRLAKPLGLTVEAAALAASREAAGCLASLLQSTAAETGIDSHQSPVFAYGGNGPLLVALAAEQLGLSKIFLSFGLGPVFSAFGTAISDVVHVYEKSIPVNGEEPDRLKQVGTIVSELFALARRDLESEGFDPGKARFSAELDIDNLTVPSIALPCSGSDMPTLPNFREAVVRGKIEFPVPSFNPTITSENRHGILTPVETREIWIGDSTEQVPVYDSSALQPNDEIVGPAVVSGGSLSCLVPLRWRLGVDEFGNGVMVRET